MSARWIESSDVAAWRDVLPASRSAFGCVELARALERSGAPPGVLLVVEVEGARVACPFTLRPVADLPFAVGLPAGLVDAASPPFTGPIPVEGELAGDAVEGVRAEIEAAFAERGVVTDFSHLHPFAAERRLVPGAERDREIVWVDTTLDADALWRESYSRSCRKNVGRAEREGITVREASDERDIAEFHRIYTQTMERNEALPAYRHDAERFAAIFEELPGNARFALAEHEGVVIAATLYLHDDLDVYSYLGGADHAHQGLRPTNAVVHDTIRWARERGKRRLILGGGYRPGDGIMRFKASFSPLRATLELGRRVHLESEYEQLLAGWRRHHGDRADPGGWFPAYRAEPVTA